MSDTAAGWLQFALLFAALAACYIPVGNYIARIFTDKSHWRIERGIYKLTGIDQDADMRWTVYVRSILAFSLVSVLFVYLIERTQHWLFWSVGMANVSPASRCCSAGSRRRSSPWAWPDRWPDRRRPVGGATAAELADAAQLSSMADYTPEGRSIAVLAKNEYGLRERASGELAGAEFVEFTAQTRMSGIDLADGRQVRKGASSAVREWIRANGGTPPDDLGPMVDGISAAGGTPLVVAERSNGTARALGVIHLKDIVKEGISERFAEMRKMGIRTVMITGDNPLTAKAIADESGVDDFLAEATPED